MSPTPAVVLIGPMGAGKTRVGKRVAKLLDTEFIDTDKVIVAANGPISAIFDEKGEPYFRELERVAVADALSEDAVVSLGGGAVLDAATFDELTRCRVVFLTVSPEAVEPRLARGGRPLVRAGIDDWKHILAARLPLYEQLADVTIDTSRRPYTQLAQEVATWARNN